MIRITYVTITYNAADVLQRTLDSVLSQDYPEIVHLIIDGASTDATLQMVDAYIERSNAAENGHRIQVTSESDKGIYDAMNKGLRSLDGDYVCFLNAGDFLPSKDTVSRIVKAIDNSSLFTPHSSLPAVLYGDTDIVDSEGHFLYHRRLAPPEHLTWKSFKQGMLVCHQAFYARTDFAIATPYDMQYRYSVLNLKMVVANYTEEGQTTKHHRESLWERYHVMERHYGRVQTFLLHVWFAIRSLFK